MPTEEDKNLITSTLSTINNINATESIVNVIHAMVHNSKDETIEDFYLKLEGLLQIFWGKNTPDQFDMKDVNWLNVCLETIPPECLLPLFKNSMTLRLPEAEPQI